MELVLPDPAATADFAGQLAPLLRAGDVLLLEGPMGAGKTSFTRALVAALGGDPEQVSSPSFTLMHHYAADPSVLHVDAWRLESAEDLAAIGFDEQLETGAIACVEWASRVLDLFQPERCWRIALEHHDGGGRLVRWSEPARDD